VFSTEPPACINIALLIFSSKLILHNAIRLNFVALSDKINESKKAGAAHISDDFLKRLIILFSHSSTSIAAVVSGVASPLVARCGLSRLPPSGGSRLAKRRVEYLSPISSHLSFFFLPLPSILPHLFLSLFPCFFSLKSKIF